MNKLRFTIQSIALITCCSYITITSAQTNIAPNATCINTPGGGTTATRDGP